MTTQDKPLLRALCGATVTPPPIWLMRQAGRYLPEYRAVRETVGSFLDLCYTPALAAEVTLQPIRRYGMDGAIIFSDILVIPHALGQEVRFEAGRGPVLDAIECIDDLAEFDEERLAERLAPVYEAVSEVKGRLPDRTALIGFAGAPWTLATYMVEGGSSRTFDTVKALALGRPDVFGGIIDVLVEAVAGHLVRQIAAGAETVQIFDTWSGVLPESAFARWCVAPVAEIVRRVKLVHPSVPVIVFPRGAGVHYRGFAAATRADAVTLDYTVPRSWARENVQTEACVQGNLDPVLLAVGGSALDEDILAVLEAFEGGPFVFNLGHGILPTTAPDHVERLVARVRGAR